MPFTVAHAVVALPFARSRRIPAAGIACGAIAPDLPLFARGGDGYSLTHAFWAVPTLDLAIGLGGVLVWQALLRPAARAVVGPASSEVQGRDTGTSVPVLLLAIVAGALSHVVWDGFTHAGRFGSVLLPVLAERLGPLPLTSWAQ